MTGPVDGPLNPNCYEVILQVRGLGGQAQLLRYQIEARHNRATHHEILTTAYDSLMRQVDA